MTTGKSPSKWKWREVSGRRVVSAFAIALGLIFVSSSVSVWLDGRWTDTGGPAMLVAGGVVLLSGLLIGWRVPKAPWP